jgi:hypothetical protein
MSDNFNVLIKPDPDYSLMLEYLGELIERRSGLVISLKEPWIKDSQVLAIKIFKHLFSARQLCAGVDSKIGNGRTFQTYDHSSINLLMRGAIESYLVLNYLYVSGSRLEVELRHRIWTYSGLLERQTNRASLAKHIEKLATEKRKIDSLKAQIEADSIFQKYSQKMKDRLLAGVWKGFKSWSDLAEAAGFGKLYFKNIYAYLCGYSHSSYACMMQIATAQTSLESQRNLSQISLAIANVVMALLIRDLKFCIPHPEDPAMPRELVETQERWLRVASDLKTQY